MKHSLQVGSLALFLLSFFSSAAHGSLLQSGLNAFPSAGVQTSLDTKVALRAFIPATLQVASLGEVRLVSGGDVNVSFSLQVAVNLTYPAGYANTTIAGLPQFTLILSNNSVDVRGWIVPSPTAQLQIALAKDLNAELNILKWDPILNAYGRMGTSSANLPSLLSGQKAMAYQVSGAGSYILAVEQKQSSQDSKKDPTLFRQIKQIIAGKRVTLSLPQGICIDLKTDQEVSISVDETKLSSLGFRRKPEAPLRSAKDLGHYLLIDSNISVPGNLSFNTSSSSLPFVLNFSAHGEVSRLRWGKLGSNGTWTFPPDAVATYNRTEGTVSLAAPNLTGIWGLFAKIKEQRVANLKQELDIAAATTSTLIFQDFGNLTLTASPLNGESNVSVVVHLREEGALGKSLLPSQFRSIPVTAAGVKRAVALHIRSRVDCDEGSRSALDAGFTLNCTDSDTDANDDISVDDPSKDNSTRRGAFAIQDIVFRPTGAFLSAIERTLANSTNTTVAFLRWDPKKRTVDAAPCQRVPVNASSLETLITFNLPQGGLYYFAEIPSGVPLPVLFQTPVHLKKHTSGADDRAKFEIEKKMNVTISVNVTSSLIAINVEEDRTLLLAHLQRAKERPPAANYVPVASSMVELRLELDSDAQWDTNLKNRTIGVDAKLSFRYNASLLLRSNISDPSTLYYAYWDDELQTWTFANGSAELDASSQVVSQSASHFSTWYVKVRHLSEAL